MSNHIGEEPDSVRPAVELGDVDGMEDDEEELVDGRAEEN